MRLVTKQDADQIAELEMKLFYENCFNEKTLSDEIERGFGWVIERSGCIVGYALVRDDGYILDLTRLGVHQEFQGQGLGQRLLNEVLSLGRETMLTVRSNNVGALRLYLRHAFRVVGQLQNGYGWVLRTNASASTRMSFHQTYEEHWSRPPRE